LPHKIEETEIQAFPTPGFLFLEDPRFGGKQTGTPVTPLSKASKSHENPLTNEVLAPNKERQFSSISPGKNRFSLRRDEGSDP
jgi:hypothetical protein